MGQKAYFPWFFQILTVELKKRIANFYSIQFLAQNLTKQSTNMLYLESFLFVVRASTIVVR